MSWQLQKAKQHFSRLVRQALTEGPQVVTRHGEDVVVVVSAREFYRLTREPKDFKAFLLAAPDLSALPIERSPEGTRPVRL